MWTMGCKSASRSYSGVTSKLEKYSNYSDGGRSTYALRSEDWKDFDCKFCQSCRRLLPGRRARLGYSDYRFQFQDTLGRNNPKTVQSLLWKWDSSDHAKARMLRKAEIRKSLTIIEAGESLWKIDAPVIHRMYLFPPAGVRSKPVSAGRNAKRYGSEIYVLAKPSSVPHFLTNALFQLV